MRKSLLTAVIATAVTAAVPFAAAQAQTASKSGVNVGSLTCTVSGGVGFVFGSSKTLDCLFARTDGKAEHYTGTIKKFGIDIGFTKEGHMVWYVLAPGSVAPGALAGEYAGGTGGAAVGAGVSANVMLGGSGKQFTLQPVGVEGSTGLNVAAGIVAVDLKAEK